jgi:hypothetical protein
MLRPDSCTPAVRVGVVLEERLIIVDDGREVRSATMLPPPVMATGVARRVHKD